MKFSSVLNCVKTAVKSALMSTEKEITIKAPWGNIAALTWGNSANPAVLLYHGRQDVCSSFRPLLQTLPDCFFYVAVDLPGHGRSDALPQGPKLSILDVVPTVSYVREHFGWKRFIFMGHSMGALIGKHFVMAYPDVVSRAVELDPWPAYLTTSREELKDWYLSTYGEHYSVDGYKKFTAGPETAPKYTYEKALKIVMDNRSLKKEACEHVLERFLVPVGNGLYRFNYERRLILPVLLPFPLDYMKDIYTSVTLPILAILSSFLLQNGPYKETPFVRDEKQWPNNNYKCHIVDGTHDFHIDKPYLVTELITNFLLDSLKGKDH